MNSIGLNFETEEVSLHSQILDLNRCCQIRAESVEKAYLVKRSLLQKLQLPHDLDDIDEILTGQAKKFTELIILTDKKRGQLVDMSGYFPNKKTPELFRLYENFELWSSRYINENIKNKIDFHGGKNLQEYQGTIYSNSFFFSNFLLFLFSGIFYRSICQNSMFRRLQIGFIYKKICQRIPRRNSIRQA